MDERMRTRDGLLYEEVAYPDPTSSLMAACIGVAGLVTAWFAYLDGSRVGALLALGFGAYVLQGVIRWWFMSRDHLPFVRIYQDRVVMGGRTLDARSIETSNLGEVWYVDTVEFPYFAFSLYEGSGFRWSSPFSGTSAKRLYNAFGQHLSVPMRYNDEHRRQI